MSLDTIDDLDFAGLDAFAMRAVARTPEQIAREQFEAAKGRAASSAYRGAINNGATPDEAKRIARKAAATFTAR